MMEKEQWETRMVEMVETISIVTFGSHHSLKGIAEAHELGTTIELMQMRRALAFSSPTLLRDYDLAVKSSLPPVCLFLCLGTAVGWSNGPFDDHNLVRSSMSPCPKATALSRDASCKSSECDSNDFWICSCLRPLLFPRATISSVRFAQFSQGSGQKYKRLCINLSVSGLFVSSLMIKIRKTNCLSLLQFPVPQGHGRGRLRRVCTFFFFFFWWRPVLLWLKGTCLWVGQGVRSVHK